MDWYLGNAFQGICPHDEMGGTVARWLIARRDYRNVPDSGRVGGVVFVDK
jgi:hypothetical protein